MTETDLREEVWKLIEKNGRATQKYLFDVFVNCKKKYKNISKYQIKMVVEELTQKRKICRIELSSDNNKSFLYYAV